MRVKTNYGGNRYENRKVATCQECGKMLGLYHHKHEGRMLCELCYRKETM